MKKYLLILLSIPLCGIVGAFLFKLDGSTQSSASDFIWTIIIYGLPNFVFLTILSFFKRFWKVFGFLQIVAEVIVLITYNWIFEKLFFWLKAIYHFDLFFSDYSILLSFIFIFFIMNLYAKRN
jgi:hypothetical protein